MPLDWSIGELATGLNFYKREEFFDAHEHWENIWRQSQGPEKPFLQALIQMAGAFHHYRRRNLRGCRALLQGALRRLEPYPERYGGILLAPLRQELAAWLAALEKSLAADKSSAPGSRDADPQDVSSRAPSPSLASWGDFPESYPQIRLEPAELTPGDSGPGDSQE